METYINLDIHQLTHTREICPSWSKKEEEAYQKVVNFDLDLLTLQQFNKIKEIIKSINCWLDSDFIIDKIDFEKDKNIINVYFAFI